MQRLLARLLLPLFGRIFRGFGLRLSTYLSELFLSQKAIVTAAITTFLTELLQYIADNVSLDEVKHPKQAFFNFIFTQYGLELKGFTKDDMLQAGGQLIANKVNLKYGTNFTAFYPPENIIEQIKAQLIAEIMEAVE